MRPSRLTSGSSPEATLSKVFSMRHIEILLALGLYFGSGPGLIFLNKLMMTQMKFAFPILVSNFGHIGGMFLTQVLVRSGTYQLSNPKMPVSTILRLLLPLCAFSVVSLITGNAAYLYLSLPLIQILKSTTTIMVMIVGFLMGVERFAWKTVVAVLIITIGIAISVGTDSERSQPLESTGQARWAFMLGILMMIISSSSEAAKTVFIQVCVDRMPIIDSLYWSSPLIALIGLFLSALFEAHGIMQVRPSAELIGTAITSALLGACVNLSNMWATKLMGGLTMKVVMTARNVGMVLFAAVFLDESCSAFQYVGYTFALVGMACYDSARQDLEKVANGKDLNSFPSLQTSPTGSKGLTSVSCE